ncbi:MAG: aldo/keto reductase [Bacteroidota bacterium]
MAEQSSLVLGTAMWGWTLTEDECFRIMDAYYDQGGRWVDSATNYPINKNPADFRRAEQILSAWIASRGVQDLSIIMKVGSINNLYTPENNLSPSFLLLCAQEYQQRFGQQLTCLMVHWDNRTEASEIKESLLTLSETPNISVGLSGIKHPEVYASVLSDLRWSKLWLQLKHNVVYSDYERYQALHPFVRCIAYGINAGGLKLNTSAYSDRASLMARGGQPEKHQELVLALSALSVQLAQVTGRPHPQKMNHLGMLYALQHPGIERVLIGVSKVEQLNDSFAWEQAIRQNDYRDWQKALQGVIDQQKKV